jgi:hypothetical protein
MRRTAKNLGIRRRNAIYTFMGYDLHSLDFVAMLLSGS